MKQETFKEAAEREYPEKRGLISKDILSIIKQEAFINGAKWQMERSYSEEEVIELLASFAEWTINGDCLYYEWFEQFKKK
jgi:hypothetical protein